MKKAKAEKMTFVQAHAKSFGEFDYQGRHFVLISRPYTWMAKDEQAHVNADAICPDDEKDEEGFYPVYNVRWPVRDQHLLDYCQAVVERDCEKARSISMEWGVSEETVIVENWDEPYIVSLTMYKYDPETISKRYAWS